MQPYALGIRKTARAALTQLRAQIPGANELVYDYNALVIGFGPNDRASEAILSIGLYPKWVSLYFLDGALLTDPEKLLNGSGSHAHAAIERRDDARQAGDSDAPRRRPRRPLPQRPDACGANRDATVALRGLQ